jgi:TRAP-type C4-dicarboxylate transport system permease small subunit
MLDRLDFHLLRLNRWALISILATMSVITFANVVLRYLTSNSIVWAEEVSRHLMIWLTFLGSGLVLRAGGHIAVDNLQDWLPAKAGRILRGAIVAAMFLFFVAMAWQGATYIAFAWEQSTAVTQIPFGFVYAAMPVGFVLMIYHLARLAVPFVMDRRFMADEDGVMIASAL